MPFFVEDKKLWLADFSELCLTCPDLLQEFPCLKEALDPCVVGRKDLLDIHQVARLCAERVEEPKVWVSELEIQIVRRWLAKLDVGLLIISVNSRQEAVSQGVIEEKVILQLETVDQQPRNGYMVLVHVHNVHYMYLTWNGSSLLNFDAQKKELK